MDQSTPGAGPSPSRLVPPANLPTGASGPAAPVRPAVPPPPTPSVSTLPATPPKPTPPAPAPVVPPQGVDLRFPEQSGSTIAGQSPLGPSKLMPTPPPAPSTAPAKPIGTPTPPTEYKTSIRTMADDMAKIKVGQQPTGTELKKPAILPPAPAVGNPSAAPVRPAVPLPPTKTSLGDTQKSSLLNTPTVPAPSRPLPTIPPAPARSSPLPPTPLPTAPRSTGGMRRWLYLAVIAVVVLAAGAYFLLQKGDEVAIEPTPSIITTTTPTPTPTPSLSSLLSGSSESIILSGTNVGADLQAKIAALTVNPGELRKVMITNEEKGSGDLDILGLMDRLLAPYPASLKTALGADSLVIVYGQREIFTTKGQLNLTAPPEKRLIFVTEVNDPVGINAILSSWEPTLADSLATLFGLNKKQAAGTGFSDTVYGGYNLRFRNYAYPDHSIDYTVIRASNGKSYLVIAASREAAFTLIDRLK